MPVSDECRTDVTDYKQKYRNLKRKLKFLIYENECFQEELRKAQRKLLKVTRDKSFLLDRLLQYEQVGDSTSDSDATVSSDSEADAPMPKKKRATAPSNPSAGMNAGMPGTVASSSGVGPRMVGRQHGSESSKRKKPTTKILKQAPKVTAQVDTLPMVHGDGHMTSEEIERHLESRQTLLDLLPEKAPPTVPTEMFSNEPSSLDSEAHEGGDDTSPSNIGDGFPEDDSLVIDLAEQGCL